jgi:hypothetical protein
MARHNGRNPCGKCAVVALVSLLGCLLILPGIASAADLSGKGLDIGSCPDEQFIRISARVPEQDVFPDVELRLVDGHGRSRGSRATGPSIPHSAYGRVVEFPDHPRGSKAVVIMVCDASPGSYELMVHETKREFYVLNLWGSSPGGSLHQPLNRYGQGDRTCRYTFLFEISANSARIDWTDTSGKVFNRTAGEDVPCEVVQPH